MSEMRLGVHFNKGRNLTTKHDTTSLEKHLLQYKSGYVNLIVYESTLDVRT